MILLLAKIINKDLEEFEREFKVRRMNYDQVVVNYPSSTGIKVFKKDDVEYIKQTEIDEFLIYGITMDKVHEAV